MNLTNNANLPEPLVEAIRNDRYAKGDADYSVTELILPPRVAELRRRYRGEITVDASDSIFALIGQGIHAILERAASGRYLAESRFSLFHKALKISGRVDLFDTETNTLQDWKITSRYTTKDGIKPEWEQQGNLNKFLMEQNGHKVERIQYVVIYRDWSKMAVARGSSEMPEKQAESFDLPIWSTEAALRYLDERITLHERSKFELPLCTDEERWYKPEKWAVMKKGRKRAIKLHNTENEAIEHAFNLDPPNGKNYLIQHRKGEHTRCLYYCEVAPYCTQFREFMEAER